MRMMLGAASATSLLLLAGCTLGDDAPPRVAESAVPEQSSLAEVKAQDCAGEVMTIFYGKATAFDPGASPDPRSERLRRTAELLPGICAVDARMCVPVVVAAGVAYPPPRGRAEAVAAYKRTTACSG